MAGKWKWVVLCGHCHGDRYRDWEARHADVCPHCGEPTVVGGEAMLIDGARRRISPWWSPFLKYEYKWPGKEGPVKPSCGGDWVSFTATYQPIDTSEWGNPPVEKPEPPRKRKAKKKCK